MKQVESLKDVVISVASLFRSMKVLLKRCNVHLHLLVNASVLQGYQDVRDRMIHRSTSQGSINSPVYSRHSYTPTMSRSPQHFHRPGKGNRIASRCNTIISLLRHLIAQQSTCFS